MKLIQMFVKKRFYFYFYKCCEIYHEIYYEINTNDCKNFFIFIFTSFVKYIMKFCEIYYEIYYEINKNVCKNFVNALGNIYITKYLS